MSFRIILDCTTLHMSKMGSATGNIWIDVNGTAFPEAEWSDFPITILGWWLQAYIEAQTPHQAAMTFVLMDGPFALKLCRADDDSWIVELSETGRRSERSNAAGSVNDGDVLRALLDAANTLLAECDRRGWVTSDVEDLRNRSLTLRRIDAGV